MKILKSDLTRLGGSDIYFSNEANLAENEGHNMTRSFKRLTWAILAGGLLTASGLANVISNPEVLDVRWARCLTCR